MTVSEPATDSEIKLERHLIAGRGPGHRRSRITSRLRLGRCGPDLRLDNGAGGLRPARLNPLPALLILIIAAAAQREY